MFATVEIKRKVEADWWISKSFFFDWTALATTQTFPPRSGTAGSRSPQPGRCPLSLCTQKTREALSRSPDIVIYLQWKKESSWARTFFLLTVSQWQMANKGGKKNPLKSKKLVSFIWFQWSQTPGMFGSGSRVAAIRYQFSPDCCWERKKRRDAIVEEPYKARGIIETCLRHCLYCFTEHRSRKPQ